MKKILFVLITISFLSSCGSSSTVKGKLEQLELGMSKKEALAIIGNNYVIDSVSESPEGKLEILSFRASYYYPEYLLYFLDGRLKEFHRVVPPIVPTQEVHVVKENKSN